MHALRSVQAGSMISGKDCLSQRWVSRNNLQSTVSMPKAARLVHTLNRGMNGFDYRYRERVSGNMYRKDQESKVQGL